MNASAIPSPAGGGRFFTGFTKLCKGLAVIIFLVHILVHLFPSAATYLTLIPASRLELKLEMKKVIMSIVGLLLLGKVLEPLWGAKELLKFIFIVNLSTSACVFVTTIVLYYITQEETYLYTPVSGFYGVLSGLLVGIKQILPDQELNLFVLKISAKWIPSIVAFTSVVVSFFVKESISYLPIILFGIYMSWIYLRYFQRSLEVGLKGDPSDEFSFSSFFPVFLRPVLDPIASIFHKLFCGRSAKPEGTGQTLDGSQFPGLGSIEANRRRERGQRALEQRLAEKPAAVRNTEGTPPPKQQLEDAEDDASDEV
ncbi:Rhomboid-like protein 19 [Zea mays]|uniref:Rhomboid-like protein 19 n=1 Tax=Zea mays TaxID=4577 RepID=A0A1D6K3Q8_MAIZE|nr:Rhomboid-like protein 19 [Zea mays]